MIKKIIKRIHLYINKPGELFRYNSPNVRSLYSSICKSLFYFSFKKRKNFFDKKKGMKDFNQKSGHFSTQSLANENILQNAISSADLMFNEYLINLNHSDTNQKKQYLHEVLKIDNSFDINHPIMQLALSNHLVDTATSYLKFLPILSQIRLWYSPNEQSSENQGSQLFHLDYSDISQVKVFIPIEEIDIDSGPLTFLPAHISKNICNSIDYKLTNDEVRVPDKIINSYINEKDYCRAIGKPGDVFFVDTSNCLHFGSRGATKSRKLLMIQYISPFSFSFPLNYKNKTTFSHLSKSDMDIRTKLLLGSA